MDILAPLQMAHDRQAATMAQPRYGTVQSYNPATYTARVMIEPDGVLSGWLPVQAIWIGNGWGFVCPPSPGDQVTLDAHDGDPNSMKITGRVFSSAATPPAANSGELVMIHKSGSFIKLLNDGGIHSSGTWSHVGNLNVTGGITATQDIVAGESTGDLVSLQNHDHLYNSGNAGQATTSAPVAGS